MSTYNVKSTRLLSSYPQNFIHLFIHSQVKFLWLFSLTYTLMCSLLWPGHFIFYSCVGYWRVLYWFGDPLSCQASGNDQWKVCIYYISSQSQFCQEGNNSWTRIFVVFQLFESPAQVCNPCLGGGGWGGWREGALDFEWRGCSNGGKNQNQKKFLGLPTEPKNVMGPFLTSKA